MLSALFAVGPCEVPFRLDPYLHDFPCTRQLFLRASAGQTGPPRVPQGERGKKVADETSLSLNEYERPGSPPPREDRARLPHHIQGPWPLHGPSPAEAPLWANEFRLKPHLCAPFVVVGRPVFGVSLLPSRLCDLRAGEAHFPPALFHLVV